MLRQSILLLSSSCTAYALEVRSVNLDQSVSTVQVPQERQEFSSLPIAGEEFGVEEAPEYALKFPPAMTNRVWWPEAAKAGTMQATAVQNADDGGDEEEDAEEDDIVLGGPNSPTVLRPETNASSGANIIKFGLFARAFYGINLKTNSYVLDVVMSLSWTDARVKALIPAGLTVITLSRSDALKKIWLPKIEITNREINRYDVISTSVTINDKGEVFKVERAMAQLKTKYILDNFPFDEQNLEVKIASTEYMIDEVTLVPDLAHVGGRPNLMDGESYTLGPIRASVITSVEGPLKKSRGLLTINVDRDLEKYTQSHLIPASLITMISWGVFWFPFVAPFITPRLALSVLALMSFINLSVRSNRALPPGAPFNWNDLINETVLIMIFLTVVLNITADILFHSLKLEDLARSINHECKGLLPFVSISSLVIILSAAGRDGWMKVNTADKVVTLYIFIVMTSYIAWLAIRIYTGLGQKKADDAAKAKKTSIPANRASQIP